MTALLSLALWDTGLLLVLFLRPSWGSVMLLHTLGSVWAPGGTLHQMG